MKEKIVTIELTARQAFALTHAGIKKVGKRKAFGVPPLSPIIHDQVREQITPEEFEILDREWKAIKVS